MWADNETDIDLLGFEFLVDELEVLLTQERLLPVTVGVSGDWGSGKSSLMWMARTRLETGENKDKYICVSFSPWRFEDFRYGKIALMAAVVDAIADYADENKGTLANAAEIAKGLRRKLHEWGVWRHAAEVGATAAGAGPEEAKAAGAATDVVTGAGLGDEDEHQRSFETIAHFHEHFEELIEELGDEIKAIVVFIDDMDRCSTETIVETFEAMRLFLHAPKTAYVVGAHEEIVEAALDGRYPAPRESDEALGRNYLEKMLQNTIAVPPLSEPEALTYINLLFGELYASADDYKKLREAANENRARNQLAVAMNEGIARDTIGEPLAEFSAALAIAAQVAPLLARHLRGNPRQLKRFLNKLLLRIATAEKRGMALDADKLAKLMVLEELHPGQFEQLFAWQLDTDTGAPSQLGPAERIARGERPRNVPDEIKEWVAQPGVRDWLQLEPALAEVPLGPYYTFSRDRIGAAISAARLPADLQQLLGELQGSVDPKRVKAVENAAKLEDAERAELLPALLEAAQKDLAGPAGTSLVELASERPEVATAMLAMLDKLPRAKVKGNFVLRLGSASFKDDPRLQALLQRWAESGSADVTRQAKRALGQS